jgi:RNA polymerase sigma-70 factor (ECF subfamily)
LAQEIAHRPLRRLDDHVDELLAGAQLSDYHLAHSARADMCRRLGRIPEARASYEKALALAQKEPERRFLARRLEELK